MTVSSVEGIDEVRELLRNVAPKVARNLLRATVQGVASSAAKEIKNNVPVLTGDLKKSVKAKRLNRKGVSGNIIASVVTISAKTAPTPKRPAGTFQWLHVEYGTQHAPAQPFVAPVVNRIKENFPAILTEEFKKKLAKHMARELGAN